MMDRGECCSEPRRPPAPPSCPLSKLYRSARSVLGALARRRVDDGVDVALAAEMAALEDHAVDVARTTYRLTGLASITSAAGDQLAVGTTVSVPLVAPGRTDFEVHCTARDLAPPRPAPPRHCKCSFGDLYVYRAALGRPRLGGFGGPPRY